MHFSFLFAKSLRYTSIVAQIVLKYNYYLPIDLSDVESRVLLGSWVNADPSSLSTYVDSIVNSCRGSPMAIALIGAILKRKNTEARWKYIAENLETKALVLSASTNSMELRYIMT